METFVMLDETDFNRLHLNTGQRKKIQKFQRMSRDTLKEPSKESTVEYEEYEYVEEDAVSLEKVNI